MVPRRLILLAALVATSPAFADPLDIEMGRKLYEMNWLPAGATSVRSLGGLGPFYDAPSCASCHGAGALVPMEKDSFMVGLVLRLGDAKGGTDPVYGAQLQSRAVGGLVPEGIPDINWVMRSGLRVTNVAVAQPGYGPLAAGTKMSLRRPTSLRGVGALAAIPEAEILSRTDPNDADHDGIMGRAAWVQDGTRRVLGRFGWKATQPSIASQTEAAFSRDMGLSTSGRPDGSGECSKAEAGCRAAPHGGFTRNGPEVADFLRDRIVAFLQSIPVPRPQASSPQGATLFARAGCAVCHATLHDGTGRQVAAYTDLLLHDMGPGLNDGIGEGAAAPGQWRTAPLWDVAASLKSGGLLHDGRAPDVTQAIAWHAGEASAARARFGALPPPDKAALVAFVSGL